MILQDRGTERTGLDALIGNARGGLSGVAVLRGAAGIGKTALLGYAMDAASDMQVTHAAGMEADQELAFATLHRLLAPFLDRRDRLPPPQLAALETALGMREAPAPDRFLVGLAVLTLLADAASDTPLVVVCDDAQWVDRESIDVLAFVGRRLYAESIVLLFGLRDDPDGPASLGGLAEMHVLGLEPSDALELFASHSEASVDRVFAEHVVASLSGNPLAIREVARAAAPDRATLGGPLPIDRRLEARFLGQARELPEPVQALLTVAAAEPTGDLTLVGQAMARLGHSTASASADGLAAAVETAEDADLLTVLGNGRVVFRHPLIRSAVYAGAPSAERRRVHAALAAVTPTDTAEAAARRVWHRAAASDGPDESVAAELAASAERAQGSGGFLAQAALLHRAAELSEDDLSRGIRLLAACGAALTAGAPHRADALLDLIPPGHGLPVLDAYAARLRGFVNVMLSREGAVALLLSAARTLLDADPSAGRETLLEAFDAAMVVPRVGPGVSARDAAHAALGAPPPSGPPQASDLLLTAHATLVAEGYVPAAPMMHEAVAAMRAEGAEHSAARWTLLGLVTALDLWDIEAFGECARRYASAARDQGALRMLQIALAGLGAWEVHHGNFAAAELHYAEFRDVADAIGADERFSHPSDVLLHAWRGAEAETLAAVAAHDVPDVDRPGGLQVQLARSGLATLRLGQRRFGDAQEVARRMYDEDAPTMGGASLADLVEAAVRSGDRPIAEAALGRLAERAVAAGTPWASALLTRSRALLAGADQAEALFREALAILAATDLAPEQARTHLLYGEWLRSRRRRKDARDQLRTAHTLFADMGAYAFAERSRLELLAVGEQVERAKEQTAYPLTPQERRIARLAAAGATNQDIAAELFLSTNTVEHHVGRIFRKLGVTSRAALAGALRPQA